MLGALRNAKLTGPRVEDYHGDLQMHSTWSDGSQTLEDIVETGIGLGYAFCAVTDHSYGLQIAGGVSMAELAEQHTEIDALNRTHRGRFRLLKGIEANIRGDGSVDMEPYELARLEIVVAAPHSVLRSPDDQTARMVAAVSAPGVHILGHPRGRMIGSRPGVSANWDRVFEAARRSNVAIEIDGDPSRQDLDYDLARRAVNAGCLFALDSDAHSTGELPRYAQTAIAHARLAGVPTERVDQLLAVEEAARMGGHPSRRALALRFPDYSHSDLPVISRWLSPAARSSFATIGGRAGRSRHSSARPPAASTVSRQRFHHRATNPASGSMISTRSP